MKIICATLALALLVALPLTGCGDDDEQGSPVPVDPPTKEAIGEVLRALLAALEAEDHDRALACLVQYPGKTDEDAKKALDQFIPDKEISAKGIDVLVAEGRLGTVREIVPEMVSEITEAAGVPEDACYALLHMPALVIVHQGPEGLRVVFINDLGEL